jgi:hypothetical protein
MSEWDSAVNLALNVARSHCKQSLDPHVVLEVFRYFRQNQTAKRIYLSTTGCETGFETDNEKKAILNPLISRQIAAMLRAKAGEVVPVDNEFIASYSVLIRD